jgi:hypothetical protein
VSTPARPIPSQPKSWDFARSGGVGVHGTQSTVVSRGSGAW